MEPLAVHPDRKAHFSIDQNGTIVSNTTTSDTASASDIKAALTTARTSPSPQAQMRAALRAKGINAAVLDERRRTSRGKPQSKAARRAEAAKIRSGYLAGKQWADTLDADDQRMYLAALEAASRNADLTVSSADADGNNTVQEVLSPNTVLDRIRNGLHWHGGDPADQTCARCTTGVWCGDGNCSQWTATDTATQAGAL